MNNKKIKEIEILEKIKKPFKHLLNIDDDDIIDIWKQFDKDYEKSQ